ncbi:unnamed protein product [marine sediment metagenome]|uniref:Uncharacterized protein n=1 Tax=marine sediment metagenome TaxID=412755 RepID=X1I1J5_9ZZZZ
MSENDKKHSNYYFDTSASYIYISIDRGIFFNRGTKVKLEGNKYCLK